MDLTADRSTPLADPERQRVLDLLRRHGWNATSFQVLEPDLSYAFDGDDACVAYVDTGGAWVAAGAPIAAVDRMEDVARRFVDRARNNGRRASFFATEQRFATITGMPALRVGEQPIWDPSTWDETLRAGSSLRAQLRRARAKGVSVRRVPSSEIGDPGSAAWRGVEALVGRWLGTRPIAPMGFLVDVEITRFPEERRYFLAEHGDRVVGILVAVPVYARGGWLFEDVLRERDAPNGTTELLIDAAMRQVGTEGSTWVTLGLAPLAGDVNPALRLARAVSNTLYDFRGVYGFKARLRPNRWEPIFLAHPEGVSATLALADVLAAFARGSFTRFGIETVLRGPAFVVRLLAVLLVPWTIALGWVEPLQWFPSLLVRDLWVGFDVGLTVGLFALASRWQRELAVVLASLITADGFLTVLEAVVDGVWRVDGVPDALVLGLACLGPLVAASILWGAIGHRAQLTAG